MKNKFILLILLFIVSYVFSQTNSMYQKPEIIPNTPSSQAFRIYGDYPVSYAFGLTDITIPLYEIKVKDLIIPITLKYHHDGIKFYETQLSNVATGWVVDVGGMVSRNILGDPDKKYEFVQSTPFVGMENDFNENNCNDFKVLQALSTKSPYAGVKDSEYDIFSYSINGRTGKFIWTDPITKFPHNSMNININNSGHLIQSFEITDEDGVYYRFGKPIKEDENSAIEFGPGSNFQSNWYMTNIVTPDGDSIIINYRDAINPKRGDVTYKMLIPSHYMKLLDKRRKIIDMAGSQYNPNYSKNVTGNYYYDISVEKLNMSSGVYFFPNAGILNYDYFYVPINQYRELLYNVKTIDYLVFPGGKILFESSDSSEKITQIKILDNNNYILKNIIFDVVNFDVNGKWTRLNNLSVTDGQGNVISNYNFEYYPNLFPDTEHTNALDYWGYYNGEVDNKSLIPNFIIPISKNGTFMSSYIDTKYETGNQDCNKTPKLSTTLSCMLKKIIYPTKGSTEFIYELNRYGSNNTPGGGLRIKNIVNSDENGTLMTKTYTYGEGNLELEPTNSFYYLDAITFNFFQIRYDRPNYPAFTDSYKYRERIYGQDMNPLLTLGGGDRIIYKEVIEYIGTGVDNSGRVIYKFNDYNNFYGYSLAYDDYAIPKLRFWKRWQSGSLKEKRIQKKTTDVWEDIQIIQNNYEMRDFPQINNLNVIKRFFYPSVYFIGNYQDLTLDSHPLVMDYCQKLSYYCLHPTENIFLQEKYGIKTNTEILTSTIDSLKTDNGVICSQKKYIYEIESFLKPTAIIKNTSQGYDIEEKIFYPISDTFKNTSPYNQMILRNILTPIIQKTVYKKDKNTLVQLSNNKVNYSQVYNFFKPSTCEISTLYYPLREVIKYNKYDCKGNIQQLIYKDIPYTYLWSYNYQYPIIEIVNATYQDFLHAINYSGTVIEKILKASSPIDIHIRSLGSSLRSKLPNALITTFTYHPLVGVTSKTDPRGITTYYEYDNFNRLKRSYIFENGSEKTVETFDYHYKP